MTTHDAVTPAQLMETPDWGQLLFLQLDESDCSEPCDEIVNMIRRRIGPVVGITDHGRNAAIDALAQACDTTLTSVSREPWTVEVSDVAEIVNQIRERVGANPQSASLAANVFRGSPDLPQRLLILESLHYSLLLGGSEFRAWRASRPRRAPCAEPKSSVLLERQGDTLIITLDRPERHNAFDRQMRDELIEALHIAVLDESIDRLELAGRGPSFCAGGDLDEFGTATDQVAAHLLRISHSAPMLLLELGQRTTARLHGWCIGSGIELAAFAGRVVADRTTHIQLPELALGLIPGSGGTVSISRRCGRWRAFYLYLTGAVIDAPTALDWGLIDYIAD